MSSPDAESRAERAGRMLARAAEIMLSAMEETHDALAAAEAPEAKQGLAVALARVNRGLRQTLLLEARLESLAADAARKADDVRRQAAKAATQAAATELKVRARGLVLETCESREAADDLLGDLELWVEDYAAQVQAGAPIEEMVIRLCRDLGLVFEPHELPPAMRTPAAVPPLAAPNSS